MEDGRISWCDVCSDSTINYPEPVGDHIYWCCADCATLLAPLVGPDTIEE